MCPLVSRFPTAAVIVITALILPEPGGVAAEGVPTASTTTGGRSTDGDFAAAATLDAFLGEPLLIEMQELWKGRGGWGGVLSATDGTVIAIRSPGGGTIRRSHDGGRTWNAETAIDPDGDPKAANGGNALLDEVTGDVLYVNPGERWLYRSRDCGATWTKEVIEVRPDGFGLVPKTEGAGAMQCGITLAFGPHRGRLLSPARIMGPKDSNDVPWRPYHYSTAIWSDDGGRVWQTSKPFPVLGTGEAAIAELSDGSLLYNSREHMCRVNRFFDTSTDCGDLWIDARRSPDLPDGPRGTSYGLMAGMIRLPIRGRDILIYSSCDTDAGQMPAKVGASIAAGRERTTVWASFDGGRTWPIKRLVTPGPGAYSCLGLGRTGTPGAGRIHLIFEGGPAGSHSAVQVATFNLAWLLDGREVPAG
ncbi:MAG: exo-alpha-sialidase [Planctomycetaceae bacterium]